jgi:uncharacterized protein (DUF1800 family)
MSARHIALNRFGLGARPAEATLTDPREWLRAQLTGNPPALSGTPPGIEAITTAYRAQVAAIQSKDPARRQQAARDIAALSAAEVGALLTTRVTSERPFAERWIAFWSNHLCVSSAAGIRVSAVAGHYEREAIRPNVFGAFEDLLLASAKHPAMLAYLDNAQSVGPGSPIGRRGRRGNAPAGLNENYARELLELHTLGVDGGYTQRDVEQLARILTGWTVQGLGGRLDRGTGPIGFLFLPAMHEPGHKEVLGVRHTERGEEEGVRVLRDLARHPSTARFLATKIARHFVADDPPPTVVEALVTTWRATGGDLRAVATTLVAHEDAWDPAHRKFRTPQDWLVAVLRATGVRELNPAFGLLLRQLGHQPWAPSAPKGYGDLTREWADPDALMNRAELARSLADRLMRDRRARAMDPASLTSTVVVLPGDPLPGVLADRTIPIAERVALAVAGPAFQWRG